MSDVYHFPRKEAAKSQVFSALTLNLSYSSHGKSSTKYNMKPFLQQGKKIQDLGNSWYSTHKFGDTSRNLSAALKYSPLTEEESTVTHRDSVSQDPLLNIPLTAYNPVILDCFASLSVKEDHNQAWITSPEGLTGSDQLKDAEKGLLSVPQAEIGLVESQELLREIGETKKVVKAIMARKPKKKIRIPSQSSRETETMDKPSSVVLPQLMAPNTDVESKEGCGTPREPEDAVAMITPLEDAQMMIAGFSALETPSEACSAALSCASLAALNSAENVTEVTSVVPQLREEGAVNVLEDPVTEVTQELEVEATLGATSALLVEAEAMPSIEVGESSILGAIMEEAVGKPILEVRDTPSTGTSTKQENSDWLLGKLKSIFLCCS